MDAWQMLMGVAVGLGLAAACGFRVFVPLLAIAIAKRAGADFVPDAAFGWVESDLALVVLIAATAFEIGAYYVPWIDNLLDTVATPAAGIAGTLVMMGMLDGAGMPESLQWGLGIIGGGGSALSVQGLTVVARGASSLTTGGLGNSVVATTENLGSSLLSLIAVLAGPVVLVALVAVVFWVMLKLVRGGLGKSRGGRRTAPDMASGSASAFSGGAADGPAGSGVAAFVPEAAIAGRPNRPRGQSGFLKRRRP